MLSVDKEVFKLQIKGCVVILRSLFLFVVLPAVSNNRSCGNIKSEIYLDFLLSVSAGLVGSVNNDFYSGNTPCKLYFLNPARNRKSEQHKSLLGIFVQ